MRSRLVAVLLASLVVLSLGAAATAPASAAGRLPSEATWKADVKDVMKGSLGYLDRRAASAKPGERLAINLDIDNTSLASEYDKGKPVGPVLAFARRAHDLGIAVMINTARSPKGKPRTLRIMAAAGYEVDDICFGRGGGPAARADRKRDCRIRFEKAGFTIVANVGNRGTDFKGGHYEREYRLPGYGGKLS